MRELDALRAKALVGRATVVCLEDHAAARGAQATRAALVSAGRALFAERGYAAVSVAEIVKRAGVTTGALYHQFGGKAELFAATYAEVLHEVSASIVKSREVAERPTLLADCGIYLDACVNPAFHRIVLVDGPAVLGSRRVLDTAELMIEGGVARRGARSRRDRRSADRTARENARRSDEGGRHDDRDRRRPGPGEGGCQRGRAAPHRGPAGTRLGRQPVGIQFVRSARSAAV
ncbi:MAG: helix-turn-helix transcriptional regulator [Solirubrobacterales bacterium]|nr:helix-turn-helix transcriptional regulator [Solirubrobacterales bacterium]